MIKAKRLNAFTLMELMIAALILALVLVGLLASYVSCVQLAEIARETSIAINGANANAEEITKHDFASIKADYDEKTFTPDYLNGIGISYVDDTNSELLKITVTVCWRQQRGRVVGEDKDLDGQIDAGEDANGNGMLDSIAQIVTYIAKK
ncbi:MAG: prepilin-type N-terminal cleavage/methylation domain-containing protein [Candidatus Omnitrophica bacterium]|nr:prepilin-type N-terminal cleavage/methylation domain-containing protein [Candidatus Omnitrophota bacterium]